MGRMEALIVAALCQTTQLLDLQETGRSPYEEQLVTLQENSPTLEVGQRYDDRGHPVNSETRQRMRDHVRASNEVMQAAGIIEETSDIRARDKAFRETLQRETDMGLRRLEIGRVLLVAGVWGVCGLRRRILLYKTYSGGLISILRHEETLCSVLHMASAGLPALAIYQCLEWVGLLTRAAVSGPNDPSKWTAQTKPGYHIRVLRGLLDYGFGYVMLNYQLFAILEQLNLWPSGRLLPSLRSLIPFSAYSPLQLTPLPSRLTIRGLLSWTVTLFRDIAPFGLILNYTWATSRLSSIIYAPLYQSLPRPLNQPDSMFSGVINQSEYPERMTEVEYDFPDSENHLPPDMVDTELNTHHASSGPSQHTATLQALEGRLTSHDDSGDEDDHEMSQQTLITFDVEATEMTEATMGTWSAELRSANEPFPRETIYKITALTMLPPLLAAEGLSAVLAGIALLPLEALMVRTIERFYRRSAGLGTGDLYQGIGIPWSTMVNIFAVNAIELAFTGVFWAAFTIGSQVMAGDYLAWNSADEAGKDE